MMSQRKKKGLSSEYIWSLFKKLSKVKAECTLWRHRERCQHSQPLPPLISKQSRADFCWNVWCFFFYPNKLTVIFPCKAEVLTITASEASDHTTYPQEWVMVSFSIYDAVQEPRASHWHWSIWTRSFIFAFRSCQGPTVESIQTGLDKSSFSRLNRNSNELIPFVTGFWVIFSKGGERKEH